MTWLTSARMGARAVTSGMVGLEVWVAVPPEAITGDKVELEVWVTLTVPLEAITGDKGCVVTGTTEATMLVRGMVLAVIPGEAWAGAAGATVVGSGRPVRA